LRKITHFLAIWLDRLHWLWLAMAALQFTIHNPQSPIRNSPDADEWCAAADGADGAGQPVGDI